MEADAFVMAEGSIDAPRGGETATWQRNEAPAAPANSNSPYATVVLIAIAGVVPGLGGLEEFYSQYYSTYS